MENHYAPPNAIWEVVLKLYEYESAESRQEREHPLKIVERYDLNHLKIPQQIADKQSSPFLELSVTNFDPIPLPLHGHFHIRIYCITNTEPVGVMHATKIESSGQWKYLVFSEEGLRYSYKGCSLDKSIKGDGHLSLEARDYDEYERISDRSTIQVFESYSGINPDKILIKGVLEVIKVPPTSCPLFSRGPDYRMLHYSPFKFVLNLNKQVVDARH
jgi:hypothetical protein